MNSLRLKDIMDIWEPLFSILQTETFSFLKIAYLEFSIFYYLFGLLW